VGPRAGQKIKVDRKIPAHIGNLTPVILPVTLLSELFQSGNEKNYTNSHEYN
jgi:hypothetical protein